MAIVAVCRLAILKRMPARPDSGLRHQEDSTSGSGTSGSASPEK